MSNAFLFPPVQAVTITKGVDGRGAGTTGECDKLTRQLLDRHPLFGVNWRLSLFLRNIFDF